MTQLTFDFEFETDGQLELFPRYIYDNRIERLLTSIIYNWKLNRRRPSLEGITDAAKRFKVHHETVVKQHDKYP
jgi:hypothetical protein